VIVNSHHAPAKALARQRADAGDRGFTLSEVIVVVFLIAMLSTIVIGSIQDSLERARISECFVELRGIQAALWSDTDGGSRSVDPAAFWQKHYNGSKPGPYVLLVDEDSTGGVGASGTSNADGDDSVADPNFVVVGRYEHWPPGLYVFIEDDRPPMIVTGPDDDPGYGEQIDWENGRQWGVGDAPSGTGPGVGWAGTRTTGTEGMGGGSGLGSSRSAGSGSGSGSSTTTGGGSGRTTTSSIGD
jgi:prepilin-type N-terminal cleavage/methylation domain-containing protein